MATLLLRTLFVDYFWIWWIAAFAVPALCIWRTGGSFGSDDTTKTLGGLILFLFIGIGCLGEWLHKKIYPYGF
ncbi:MAG: hypothetical protein DU429_01360 [Candidatus Tokpelaia sp.]|nr:MAG: hypothetical protein DU429_01360 [Candidatus Tokpelaia sp.]